MADDTRSMIRKELSNYPVDYVFGQGGKHPFVRIASTADPDRWTKVPFAGTPNGHNLYNIRSNIRQALRDIGISRCGVIGHKLVEAKQQAKQEPAKMPITPIQTTLPRSLLVGHGTGTLNVPLSLNSGAPENKAESPPPNGPAPQKAAEKGKRPQLAHAEVILFSNIMNNYAKVDDEKKLVTYKEGWNDARVLAMIHAKPGRSHIRLDQLVDLRQENYGYLPRERTKGKRRATPKSNSSAQYKNLKATVDMLIERIEVLEGAIIGPGHKAIV
jgi:hypothetical protein